MLGYSAKGKGDGVSRVGRQKSVSREKDLGGEGAGVGRRSACKFRKEESESNRKYGIENCQNMAE